MSLTRPRPWELGPEVVLAAGLTFFLIDEPDAATSAFKSGRAIGLMVVVAVLWLAARLLAARFLRMPLARVGLFAVAAAGVLAVVVIPAYDDETVVEALADSQPTRLRVGSFAGIDHRAAGTVAIYRRGDGRFLIGLEDFDIQPGPDYDVYVVRGTDRRNTDNGRRVDDLRGNRGTQFYVAPAEADLDDGPWTVLIWCQTFSVPVANATPA